MAMLITINAKWYQRDIEKILIRVISYARLESETKKISGSMERLFSMGYKNYTAYLDDCLLMFSVVIFSGIL
ncbi:MAG: hypothetical protein FP829_01245 [Nitrospirae bacterium]|nr:hypothetical protein [Nitrospirota bacterium]